MPTSIISFFITWFWNSENIEYYALIAGLFHLVSSLFFILLGNDNDILNKESNDENLLLNSELNENGEKESDISLEQIENKENDVINIDVDDSEIEENDNKSDQDNAENK